MVDPNGEIVYESTETIESNSSCNFYEHNLLTGGDFDDGEVENIWRFPNGKPLIHWDGYIKDGLKVTDFSTDGSRAVVIDISHIVESGQYVIQERALSVFQLTNIKMTAVKNCNRENLKF